MRIETIVLKVKICSIWVSQKSKHEIGVKLTWQMITYVVSYFKSLGVLRVLTCPVGSAKIKKSVFKMVHF